jgi:beta-phosphoglucomutase
MKRDMGVIFDVDGVLVESYDAHLESWQLLGREEGFEFSEQRFIETFGRTTREILRETYGSRQFTTEQIAALDHRKEELFRQIMVRDFPAMNGAKELIDQLHATRFQLAVGSSGPPPNVQLVLETLERAEAFQAVVTGVDVTRGKPDPQVFLLAAQRLNLPSTSCVVIEDAPAGVHAAKNAGMPCIALVSKGHTFDELKDADLRVASLRELSPAAIEQLLAQSSPP